MLYDWDNEVLGRLSKIFGETYKDWKEDEIMYYGKETDELKKAREEYEGIFGYDPNGEIELEFNEQDEYLAVLLQCIEEKKDMFNVLRE
mgnify:FL=1|jgi:hypothetical protein